ncbi:helix-turn-helix transcriptional regulator [Desulfosporosinus sp. OT]|uniref:helix-turn-helix transcriptional regulator n=1 Tax=Desulfosporosinus sp. OT TaxID=913865 RepID=UPI000223A035|nr:helix-turn-helix transcriptional regulator [Desulfosporosinus sp. OT]EGW38004.1 hypothetical protein DOT_4125 [Desulfosporosinus sp. OT]
MNYKTDMKRCRNCIEAHIYEELTPRRLAELLGYSFYHFCHVSYAVFTTDPADLAHDKGAFANTIQKTWKYFLKNGFSIME